MACGYTVTLMAESIKYLLTYRKPDNIIADYAVLQV